jgi:hypothetical protein
MSVAIYECNPDVSIKCDGCHQQLDEEDSIYCEWCFEDSAQASGTPVEMADCSRCKNSFARNRMISKVAGTMCIKCAHAHELELLAALQPAKAS